MLLSIPAGTASKIIQIPIFDSSSTIGALLAGLVYNTASLTAYYNREGAAGAGTAITLATATKGTWVAGGFIAVDGTSMPGWYELHIPDAALASGAKSVSIHLKGAANMVPVPILIELTAVSNQDAVRGGMTALPASGTLAVNPILNSTQTGVTIPTVTTLTGHTAQTGDTFARLGAPAGASISADLLTISGFVDGIETTLGVAGAGLTALASQTSVNTIDDFLDTEIAAIKAKTDLIPAAPAATGDIPSAATIASAVLTTQLAESYRTDGASPTLAQGICEMLAHEGEVAIAGTTKTIKKFDGTTTAETFTLDSATTPTSITRAT